MRIVGHNRREFLGYSLAGTAALGIGTTVPSCFVQAAGKGAEAGERILVVVQMSGGNDGLNTVIPYRDPAYRSARPKLAVAASDVLKCNDDLGFHPAMSGMRELLESQRLAVVCGVGYEQPNRSHFEAMDIWHTCRRKHEPRPDGWLGRFLDARPVVAGGDVPALHLGQDQQPFAVASQTIRVPTIRDLSEFQLRGRNREALRSFLKTSLPAESSAASSENELLSFLESSTTSALAASRRVAEAAADYKTATGYPDSNLGRKLQVIAQLIDAGLTTSVYYVQIDGFDTHAQQAPTHAALLREWSDAVAAFMNDLDAHDHGGRVCLMSFSEFGRRVAENASEGTDHGAAGPMFLCGGGVAADILGKIPNLSDLQDGDLKFETDFRQVYAAVLQNWLGCDPHAILGKEFEPVAVFKSTADDIS